MFDELLDSIGSKVVVSKWLPDWAYIGSERKDIEDESIWFDEDCYASEVIVKESGLFELDD